MTDTLYRLRGLEWVKMHGAWTAKSPIGRYFIWENHGVFRWQFSDEDEQLADSLSAAQSAAEAHYRARMAEGLVPVKVLGTLPMTADGCLIGTGADLFYWHESQFDADAGGWVNRIVTGGVVSAPHLCHSTRAAAEAAKKEPTK